MFLLVSSRHVGARPDGHQHGVSIQISIHFWKNISGPREGDTRVSLSCACLSCATTSKRLQRRLNISPDISYTKDCSDLILVRVFVYLPPFVSQILDFIYWKVLLFILMDFEWCGTENQQLFTFNRPLDSRTRKTSSTKFNLKYFRLFSIKNIHPVKLHSTFLLPERLAGWFMFPLLRH